MLGWFDQSLLRGNSMGRPLSGLEVYLQWQERLKRFDSSGLSIDTFCRQENIRQSQFAQWLLALRGKPPRDAKGDEAVRSAEGPAFVPVTVKAQFIEILLPGGGLVRLSAGIDRTVLMDVIERISTVLQESQA
jgi:hypothetical protein